MNLVPKENLKFEIAITVQYYLKNTTIYFEYNLYKKI